MNDERKLTNADVEAIVELMREKMVEQFYRDLGKGLWGLMKKALFTAAFTIACYGAVRGIK